MYFSYQHYKTILVKERLPYNYPSIHPSIHPHTLYTDNDNNNNNTSNTSNTMMITVVLCLVAFNSFIGSSSAVPVLKQVQVVTRHGARTPLTKSATTLQEETATLTHIGERQLYDLGLWLRQKYVGHGVVDSYSSESVRIESSDYDRTIVSAQMLAQGLFLNRPSNPLLPIPANNTNIPVYTNSKRNDVTIRAYDKCPAFLANLNALYASETFTTLQQDHKQLLEALANIPAFSTYLVGDTIPISNLWNVFDLINVAKIECATNYETSHGCQSLPDPTVATALSDTQWTELQNVSNLVELLKYSKAGGRLLGSNLLRTIQSRMNVSATMPRFVLYSAHYPTILGLLSSLLGEIDILKEAIPNYATSLLFELYVDSETNEESVVIQYKEGLQNETDTLKLASFCNGKLSCPLKAFKTFVSSGEAGARSEDYWCDECNNESADVCLKAQLTKLTMDSSNVLSCKDHLSNQAIIALTFFGGMGMSLLLLITIWFLVPKQTSTHSLGKEDPEPAGDIGTTC
jgi:hypothetical protein